MASARASLAFLCAGLFFLIWSAPSLLAETSILVLDPADSPYDAAAYTSYVIEEYAPRDVDYDGVELIDILALDRAGQFEPIPSREIGFGRAWNLVHLKTQIQNPLDSAQTWVLASNISYRNLMTVYLLVEDGNKPTGPIYQNLKHSEWQGFDIHRNVTFELPAQATATLYVSYSNASSSLPMS